MAVNTASRFTSRIVVMVIGFALTPFLIASVGRDLLGLQVLATQSLQYCLLFSSAIGAGYARFAAVHHARGELDRMNGVLGTGLTLSVLAAGLLVVGTACLALFARGLLGVPQGITDLARLVVLITGLGMAVSVIINVWESPVFIKERFYLQEAAVVAAHVSAAVAVVILFHFHRPSITTWVGLLVGCGLMARLLFVVPAARRSMPEMRIRPRFEWGEQTRELLSFSMFGILGGLGHLLYYASDSIIISNLDELGTAFVIDYNIAQRWDPFIRQSVLAFSRTLLPVATRFAAVANFGAVRDILVRGTRHCMLLGLFPCVVLATFARPFIRYWVGESFVAESAVVMQWILAGLIVGLPAIMAHSVLMAIGRLREAAYATLLCGLANIGLSILLVKYTDLGLLGVALATASTLALKNGVYIPVLVCRKVNLEVRTLLRHGYLKALLSCVPLLAACLIIRLAWQPGSLLLVLVQIAVCGLVYACSVWVLGLTEQDRAMVLRAARAALTWIKSLRGRGNA